MLENFRGHAFGQIHDTVLIKNTDPAYVFAFNVCFIGNGADNIAWLDLVHMPDFDAIALHAGFQRIQLTLTPVTGIFTIFLSRLSVIGKIHCGFHRRFLFQQQGFVPTVKFCQGRSYFQSRRIIFKLILLKYFTVQL